MLLSLNREFISFFFFQSSSLKSSCAGCSGLWLKLFSHWEMSSTWMARINGPRAVMEFWKNVRTVFFSNYGGLHKRQAAHIYVGVKIAPVIEIMAFCSKVLGPRDGSQSRPPPSVEQLPTSIWRKAVCVCPGNPLGFDPHYQTITARGPE